MGNVARPVMQASTAGCVWKRTAWLAAVTQYINMQCCLARVGMGRGEPPRRCGAARTFDDLF